ncbi:MAG: hypothetical protein K9L26_02610 [Candidatus Izimaplasma sp.]|nr:hypothetical protein [Candidatus Izimaplasma bacterium]
MIIMMILNRYLKKQDDIKFEQFYEKWFVHRIRNVWLFAFIYFMVATVLITEILMLGTASILLSILVYVGVVFVYGSLFLRYAIRFYATLNQRYLMIKMGGQYDQFSKDNVIN